MCLSVQRILHLASCLCTGGLRETMAKEGPSFAPRQGCHYPKRPLLSAINHTPSRKLLKTGAKVMGCSNERVRVGTRSKSSDSTRGSPKHTALSVSEAASLFDFESLDNSRPSFVPSMSPLHVLRVGWGIRMCGGSMG